MTESFLGNIYGFGEIEINCVPDCEVALWEGPRLCAKVKDANGQDWYIWSLILL